MSPWAVLLSLGLLSYGLRSVVVLGLGDRPLPAVVERVAAVLAPAIMAAMVAGSLAIALRSGAGSDVAVGESTVRIVSVAVGVAVGVRTGSVGRTILAGLVVHHSLTLLVGG